MNRIKFLMGAVLLATLVSGCKKSTETCSPPDLSGITIDLQYESLVNEMDTIHSKEGIVSFLQSNPIVRDYLLSRREYPDDSTFVNRLYQIYTNPSIDTLFQEVKRVFGNEEALKAEFENAFKTIKYYYPEYTPPKVKTVVTGMTNDLFVSDTLVVVSLDFYLGDDAKYRPNFYDYQLIHYRPETIVPTYLLIYGITPGLNKVPVKKEHIAADSIDETVLADMITYGKAFYFAKQMLPCVPDSVFMGYTSEEMTECTQHEGEIWSAFMDNEVLYSTDNLVNQRYLQPRPHTFEIGDRCPGRIGQWVGWQIVKKYMEEHPDTSVKGLMQLDHAEKVLIDSHYRPG